LLVIDPVLTFASGIGGNGIVNGYFGQPRFSSDFGSGLALDGKGNIYIAGLAYSPDFPLMNSIPLTITFPVYCCSCPSSFVAKLSPDATTILYSTLLAACSSSAPALAVDAVGNVYVAGSGGPFVQVGGGTVDATSSHAFVAKLDTNGVLKAALTFGGSGVDAANSIQFGSDGNLYVAGTTSSPDFPITVGALRSMIPGAQNLFLMKMDPSTLAGNQQTANSTLYSALLGPGNSPLVAADATGNAYVAASTTSTSWTPTAGVFQSQCWDASRTPCADAIALKVNSTGTTFVYMTYLGGSGTDTAGGLAVDASGNAYIVGTTNSFDFPATPASYPGEILTNVPFAVKLSADASHLVYGTLLSVSYGATATAVAVDGAGNMWIGGLAADNGAELFPTPLNSGFQRTLFNTICAYYTPSGEVPTSAGYCPQSGYLAELDPTGSKLL